MQQSAFWEAAAKKSGFWRLPKRALWCEALCASALVIWPTPLASNHGFSLPHLAAAAAAVAGVSAATVAIVASAVVAVAIFRVVAVGAGNSKKHGLPACTTTVMEGARLIPKGP